METTINRKTDKTTIDGKPLLYLKIDGVWGYYYESGDDLIQYDMEGIEKISFSYTEKDGDKEVVHRIETKKLLKMISGNRILGFHEYTDKDNTPKKSIVIWVYTRGSWRLSLKKGLSELTDSDIIILNTVTRELWIQFQ